jgi:RecA-family ATPase
MCALKQIEDQPNPVYEHVALIHKLAAGIDGVLVVSAFNANLSEDGGIITHHRPGDIDGMVEAIEAHRDTPGVNVYCGLQVMRRGLQRGKRGGKADVVAVLGLVADMDADTGNNAGTYPLEPNYVIETSPGNFQPFWLFDRPVSPDVARDLAARLKMATGSDHGTGEIAHIWRVPGLLNWPNKAKLDRGRSAEPALVQVAQPWDGTLTDPAALALALAGTVAPTRHAAPVELGDLPDVDGIEVSAEAAELLSANDVGDRSEHACIVVKRLAGDGHTAEEACALFLAAPGNWKDRYRDEKHARTDFERCWAKFGAQVQEEREKASKLAASLVKKAHPVADNDNFPIVNPADWHGQPVPTREWFLDELIPRRQVTILNGDGGVGKSLLALQIAAASAMGCETLGLRPLSGRVVYLGAEDEADEFHRRLADITYQHHRQLSDLADFRLIPLADRDALLSVPDRNGVMQSTANWTQLVKLLAEFRPGFLVLDTSADLFGGDEIKRSQVRQFISMLRKQALALDTAVLLLSHPSIQGMQSGSGSSGSTAWNNSVRSRLYLTRGTEDEDLRVLTTKKANYGKAGGELRMRWEDGAFVLDDGKPAATLGFLNRRHEDTFVAVLRKFTEQGLNVSANPGPTYAPTQIAKHPDAKGTTKKQLAEAMARLLDEGRIRMVTEGSASRQRSRLVAASN